MMSLEKRTEPPERHRMRNADHQMLTLPICVVCLLTIFTLGSANLKHLPIGNDEYNSLSHVQHPENGVAYDLAATIQSVAERSQQHGPLYFLMLNAWRVLAGADLFALRLFSLYFGLLTVAAAYQFARQCRDRPLGLTTLLVASFLAYQLFYSHTARMYTVLPLFACWVIWSYWHLVSATGDIPRWRWLSLLASAALILYLHYFGFMILAAIAMYHVLLPDKNRRWRQVTLLLALAVLCFVPWLPTAIEGFSHRISLAETRLPWLDSLFTYFLVFSNGLFLAPILAAALTLRYRSRLNRMERFTLLITAFTLVLTIIANELTPILVERRMRYMTLLTVPFCGSLAIGIRFLPRWTALRYPLLLMWFAAFVVFYRSEDLLRYANKIVQNLHKTPHYQDFIYDSGKLPGHNELILSFHPDTPITVTKSLRYYRAALSKFAHLVHISYDAAGELNIQSGLTTYATLDAIAENAIGIWVIHDPQQTNLADLDVYTDWFILRYQACRRYIDKPHSVITYYLRADLSCDLVNADDPFAIRYDGGAELGHLIADRDGLSLIFTLRWLQTVGEQYSFTLQLYNDAAEKVAQADRVISGEPVDIVSFDLSMLPAGDYAAHLIVYDFATKDSQSGLIVSSGTRFERAVEVARFTIEA